MRKRGLGLIAAAGVMLFALTGCGAPESGRIAQKDHREGYYSTEYQCYSYNKEGYCTVNLPYQQWHNPRWAFDLYASEDDHGWRSVTEDTYNRYDVGDWYDPAQKGSF